MAKDAHTTWAGAVKEALTTPADCDILARRKANIARAHQANHAVCTQTEQRAAAGELKRLLARTSNEHPHWMPNLGCSIGAGEGSTEIAALREEMVRVVLQAINFSRHGHAEGSLAQHPDGRWARRYFSKARNRLVWLIGKAPSDEPVEITDVDEFDDSDVESKWRVVGPVPWRVIV